MFHNSRATPMVGIWVTGFAKISRGFMHGHAKTGCLEVLEETVHQYLFIAK